jgi:predicted dinucleotide-binding enzyme
MKMAIIGTGAVAKALATGYTGHGHEVRLGTREPGRDDIQDWHPGSAAEVATWADLIVLAVPGSVAAEVAAAIAAEVGGKILVDATNPVDSSHGDVRLFTGPGESLGERVQQAAPQTRVVKAYNSVGNALMVDPDLPGGPPSMFIAGNDEVAKAEVTRLLEATGWEVLDFGGISACRLIEALVLTWVGYGIATGTWNHAFKLLHR